MAEWKRARDWGSISGTVSHLESCWVKGILILEILRHYLSTNQHPNPLLLKQRITLEKQHRSLLCSPFRTGPLSVSMNLHKQFRRVSRRCDTGVEQKVLVLGQVLGRGLLGSSGTMQQFSLQQGQVGLEKKEAVFPSAELYLPRLASQWAFTDQNPSWLSPTNTLTSKVTSK